MKSIYETAREDSRLSTSVRMAEAGGVLESLQKGGPYTAFIPTNEAYEIIPEERLETIIKDRERLADMVLYHVVQGKLTTRELSRMEAIKTLQGDHLDIAESPKGMRLNEAAIIQSDIECMDGIYHVIDHVLIPRAVKARVEKSWT
ncbi:MAG: fasciclin domain-containing protein [Methanomicrobiales archaeon]|nr:fasciclin domain-containing protein [Methanomicrobiales archaeon]